MTPYAFSAFLDEAFTVTLFAQLFSHHWLAFLHRLVLRRVDEL